MGKYGTVIGWKTRVFVCALSDFQVVGFIQPITAPYLPMFIKSRNFAKRQYKPQWLTPPTFHPAASTYEMVLASTP